MTATPRTVRVPDPLWDAARVKAEAEYTTISAVVVQLLREWTEH